MQSINQSNNLSLEDLKNDSGEVPFAADPAHEARLRQC